MITAQEAKNLVAESEKSMDALYKHISATIERKAKEGERSLKTYELGLDTLYYNVYENTCVSQDKKIAGIKKIMGKVSLKLTGLGYQVNSTSEVKEDIEFGCGGYDDKPPKTYKVYYLYIGW